MTEENRNSRMRASSNEGWIHPDEEDDDDGDDGDEDIISCTNSIILMYLVNFIY